MKNWLKENWFKMTQNNKRGFIQIPILVVIIAGVIVLGGAGYFGLKKYHGYVIKAVKEEQQRKNDSDTSINQIKTPVENKQESGSEIDQQKPNALNSNGLNQSSDQTVLTPQPTAITNPSEQCLPIKKDWDGFAVAFNDLDKEFNSLLTYYGELVFGTQNRPSEIIAKFSYNYRRMASEKSRFLSRTNAVRKMIDTLPEPEIETSGIFKTVVGTNDPFKKIKDSYLNSVIRIESSYDLAFHAFGVIAEDAGSISASDIDAATSLLDDSNAERHKISNIELATINKIVSNLQAELNKEKNGCVFAFHNDKTVFTTIKEELVFTKARPAVEIKKDHSEATVSVATILPIEVNDKGKIMTVMQLSCNIGYNAYTYPVVRLNEYEVSTKLKRVEGYGHNCRFLYTGSGESITTNGIEFVI